MKNTVVHFRMSYSKIPRYDLCFLNRSKYYSIQYVI